MFDTIYGYEYWYIEVMMGLAILYLFKEDLKDLWIRTIKYRK